MYVEGLSWGGWQRQASLSTLFRFQVWTCVKCSSVFISRGKADPPLVKSYQTRPATETFFTAGGRVWTVTAVVGVERFLLVFLTFKGLFFSSLITGLFSQWERKGSFSGVSDITQLTNPLWDLDMPKVGFFFHHIALPQRRESIRDSEAETNSHEWQISAGHLTLRWTSVTNDAHLTPPLPMTPWISPSFQHITTLRAPVSLYD